MLKLQISDYFKEPWERKNNKLVQHENFIEPFESPYVEHVFINDGFINVFIIREKNFRKEKNTIFNNSQSICKVDSLQLNELIKSTKDSDLEFIIIIIDSKNRQTRLIKGMSNNVPLYYITNSNLLCASWDLNDLYCHLRLKNIFNNKMLISHLLLNFKYSNSTIYNDINLLSERSEVVFDSFKSTIKLPDSYPVHKERLIKSEVNIFETFSSLLRRKLLIHGINLNNFICELSGGLDSAIVAIIAAQINDKPIKTIGMIFNGDMGNQQENRRREIIEKFNIIDTPAYINGLYPLINDGETLSNGKASIYDEIYHEALQYSLSLSPLDGGAVLTGIGGDELSIVYDSLEPCDKSMFQEKLQSHPFVVYNKSDEMISLPLPPIARSAIISAQARAPIFLRNGLWPINPLCCNQIVKFCQYLPKTIKENRKLHRDVLNYHGVSKHYIYPQIRENFSEFYETSMKVVNMKNIRKLIKESQLHDMGYIDKKILLKSFTNYCETNVDDNPLIYYIISSLEYNLKLIRSLHS